MVRRSLISSISTGIRGLCTHNTRIPSGSITTHQCANFGSARKRNLITVRYADAQWLDIMRAHKLVLALDEHSHTARVLEYWSAFDASAGPNDLRLNWTASRGMQFFEFERRQIFGVQLDVSGKP